MIDEDNKVNKVDGKHKYLALLFWMAKMTDESDLINLCLTPQSAGTYLMFLPTLIGMMLF